MEHYEIDATDKVGSCLVYGNVPSTTASSTSYVFKIRPKNTFNDNKYSPAKSITIYGEWIEYTLNCSWLQLILKLLGVNYGY